MPPDPYRSRPPVTPAPRVARAPLCLDVAAVATLVWLLAAARVLIALRVGETANRATDVAWLVAVFAPVVVWKEIAAQRRRRDEDG